MVQAAGFPRFWPAVLLLYVTVIAQVAVLAVIMIVAVILTSFARAEQIMLHPAMVGVINLVVFGAATWVGCVLARRPVADVLPLRRVGMAVLLPAMFAAVGLLVLLSDVDNLVRVVCPPPGWLDAWFDALSSGKTSLWASIFALSIVAPVTEECLFRGVILQGFRQQYRPLSAILLSSLLFAVFHLNPWQMASAFLIGLLFGWFTVATGSLLPGICGHAAANALPWLVGLFKLDSRLPGLAYQDVGKIVFQPWWLDAGALVVCAGSILLLMRLLRRKTADMDDDCAEESPGSLSER